MKPLAIPRELTFSIERDDEELGTGTLSTLNMSFEDVILTLAGQSH